MSEILILDPRAEAQSARGEITPRLPNLMGAVVGMLSNHKANADHLLDRLAEKLKSEWGVAEVRRYEKSTASIPAGDQVYGDMQATCVAAVVALGD